MTIALLLAALASQDLKVSVWASESDLRNPTGLSIDERGRLFVAESDRLGLGGAMPWFLEDAACRTLADRESLIQRRFAGDVAAWAVRSERVRLLEDVDGDGRADRSTIFADRFNAPLDGAAGGLLARNGELWFASVPSLWLLRDRDGDGRAEVRKPLFTGFGVRFGSAGHDLRGPVQGPDGKIYVAMGDRGFSVVTGEGERLEYPEMGAVLRCDADGGNLEVFAIGLRNPRDLVFDDLGELFCADGDRWLQVPEGCDLGWRSGFEFSSEDWGAASATPGPALKGIWTSEEIGSGKAPTTIPPVFRLEAGTSGAAVAPGTGFSGRAFIGRSSLTLKPRGAGYEAVEGPRLATDVVPVDCEFGPDGALYVLHAKGVLRVADPTADAKEVEEVRKILADGLKARTLEELAGLMGHQDRRVRLAAQQELVGRQGSTKTLGEVAKGSSNRMARIHAIWGLGQLYTRNALFPLMKDKDPEIRAQTARVLGDRRVGDAHDGLLQALKDEAAPVRRYAALALGKLGRKESGKPIAELLRANDDRDPVLRHAGAHALAMIGSGALLQELSKDASRAVRLGALLAMRRLARQEADLFLGDPELAFEAARAIHDAPILPSYPRLAAKLGQVGFPEAGWLRAINANFRLGLPAPLAAFAADPAAPEPLRVEALRALGAWARPNPRDRITGLWRPLPERDPAPAREALVKTLEALRRDASPLVRAEAEKAAAALR